MDAGQFAAGFERRPARAVPANSCPLGVVEPAATEATLGHDFMKIPKQWDSFFSFALRQRLSGQAGCDDAQDSVARGADSTRQYSPETIAQELATYDSPPTRQLFRHLTAALRDVALTHPDDMRLLNQVRFHVLSQEMVPLWRAALQPEQQPRLQTSQLTAVQTGLAVRGMELVALRQATTAACITASCANEALDRHALGSSLAGQITEVDAAITLLELMKQQANKHPGLVAVPGPSLFESNPDHSSRNSDFILIDTSQAAPGKGRNITTRPQVRGVQVKTTRPERHRYDPAYVSIIVGATDLDNTTPGIIAADFLVKRGLRLVANVSAPQAEFIRGYRGPAQALQSTAETLLKESSIPQERDLRATTAAEKMGKRLLEELYQEKAPPSQEDAQKLASHRAT